MPTNPPVALLVNGQRYGGWQTIQISRHVEQLAGSFSLGLTEQHPGKPKPWPIPEDAECAVLVDDVPIITGFLDQTDINVDENSRSVTVTGRDRAGDVVDCSAQLGAWSFSNVNVLDLAKKICAPYNVSVSLQPGLTAQTVTVPKKKYSIDPGDTAADALGNLLKLAGLLAISDGLGGIVLSRAGTERVAQSLVEGVNIRSIRGTFTTSGRFRTYEVLGSHKGRDDLSGPQAAGVKGTATDLGARAGRTLIVKPDHNLTRAVAKETAEWEASTRAARGEQITVRVPGWVESPFTPVWPVNQLVRVKAPSVRVNGEALIAGVKLTLDPTAGSMTELDLRNPASFVPNPSIVRGGGTGNNYWREIVRGV